MRHTIRTLVTTDGVSSALIRVHLGGTCKHIRINASGHAVKLCMPSFFMTLCGIHRRIFKASTSSSISKQVMFHYVFEVFLTAIQVSLSPLPHSTNIVHYVSLSHFRKWIEVSLLHGLNPHEPHSGFLYTSVKTIVIFKKSFLWYPTVTSSCIIGKIYNRDFLWT